MRLAAGKNCSCSIRLWFVLGRSANLLGPSGSDTIGTPVVGSKIYFKIYFSPTPLIHIIL